jgi:hypothetical protein
MTIRTATLDRAVRWGLRGAAVLALSIAGFGVSAPAGATPIGPATSCGSCDGAIYDLSVNAIPISGSTYRFRLSIDTNTYDPGGSSSPPYYLAEVSIKVSSNVSGASLFSAPGGTADWNAPDLGGMNANGCNGNGAGFICVDATANGGKGIQITTGNGPGYDYIFAIDVTLGSPTSLLDPASIKARYVDDSNTKVGSLLSEDIHLTVTTPPPQHDIPEPMSLLLLGLGLGGLGLARRRRPC